MKVDAGGSSVNQIHQLGFAGTQMEWKSWLFSWALTTYEANWEGLVETVGARSHLRLIIGCIVVIEGW